MSDLKLTDEAKQFPLSEREAEVRILGMRADVLLRSVMAVAMIVLFFYMNMEVICLVRDAFNTDITLLNAKLIQSDKRLITENVFMSLIGATVVHGEFVLPW